MAYRPVPKQMERQMTISAEILQFELFEHEQLLT